MQANLVTQMANYLSMDEKSAIEFLEKVAKAKSIINILTGFAQTDEVYRPLSRVYKELDELLSPFCPECNIRAKRFITSDAQLYDPELAQYPGGTRRYWTGEWYCPKCHHLVAVGEKWWDQSKR